jgi:hypothetical protein
VALVTVAINPLILTILFSTVEAKFDPVIVTGTPVPAMVGLNPEMVGFGTVKSEVDDAVIPFVVTVIFPLVASPGTVSVSWVEVASVTSAIAPLNVTMFSAGPALKFVPVTITVSPTTPVEGENSVMVAFGISASSLHDDTINAKQVMRRNAVESVLKVF